MYFLLSWVRNKGTIMSELLNFFPIKVYKTQFDQINDLKSLIMPKLEVMWDQASMVQNEITDCVVGRTDCGYVIDPNLEKWPEMCSLIDFLNVQVCEYWQQLGYSKSLEPYVHSMWSNRTYERSYIHSHIHSPMPIAGTVYLDVNKDMGNFILEDPNEMLLRSQPVDNPDAIAEVEINVSIGDVIMFPGYVRHRTVRNITSTPRITLPFVVGCKGSFPTDHWRSA